MARSIMNLIARIEDTDSADVSLKDVNVLAKSQDPEAIFCLAGLLDDDGRVGREAARALKGLGRKAEEALRCYVDAANDTARGYARELLAALGNAPVETVEVLPAPEATNDNREEAEVDATPLADPEVTRAIGGTLYARGVPVQEIDDAIAEVQTRVLEMLRVGEGPKGLAEWRALGTRVATELAIDRYRKQQVQKKRGDERCEDPDAFVRPETQIYDPIDAHRMFVRFQEMIDAGELPPQILDILEAKHGGLTDAETAEELGLTRVVVFKRRSAMTTRFAEKLLALGMSELVPRRAKAMEREKDGEAAPKDDLPDSLLRG